MLRANNETFLECDKDFEASRIILFGAPFDSSTSYRPGTRFGSSAIRRESYGIESYSPYLDRDLVDLAIMDSGDIELPFGDTKKALDLIKERAGLILSHNKLPFMTGGEHLVTLGAFGAAFEKYPDINIIHFDAHADLRDDYLGVKLSHASVIHRCWELTGDNRIFQFGIRSGDREEFKWGKEHVKTTLFNFEGLSQVLKSLKDKPVYFTVDLDVLDPSVFPGTGTPEPGGVSFEELRKAVTMVCSEAHVIACDINELNPHYDQSGVSTIVACKIAREMLIALHENIFHQKED